MNCDKVGKLIYNLRKEKNMTQKEIADLMNISDKTISKWERGLGCSVLCLSAV
jgi:transcriptional regulator with XRE-family HTH domain